MRILITGGFGFVGGRVAQHLHHAGHQIILGSHKVRSSPEWFPKAKLAQIDWHNDHDLEKICCGVDVVIQAAGMNAQDCAADPVAALEFNGLATAHLVAAASRAKVKRFIYLSTAHVYASPLIGTITEDTCPRNLHPYATSHLAGESVVLSASQRGQIEGIVLRLSNVFGAPVTKDVNCWMLLVNDLCRQAVQTGKMVLRSSGLQQRDFVAITDVCSLLEHLLSRDFGSGVPEVINVGAGRSQSVLEMAQFIQQRCKVVLGFEPELMGQEIGVDERQEKLVYLLNRLKKMGLIVGLDNSTEIEKLLAFCRASFNHSRSERA